jgi:hypothetical protein
MEKNMKNIKVSELKDIAKKKRKDDQSIKNHSESLKIVAMDKGFKRWEDLLDHCVLPLDSRVNSNSKDSINSLNDLVNIIVSSYNEFNDIFESNDEKLIAYYIFTRKENKESQNNDNYLNSLELLKYICHVYTKTAPKKEYDDLCDLMKEEIYYDCKDEIPTMLNSYNYFYKLFNLEYLLEITRDKKSLLNKEKVSFFENNILVSHIKSTPYNPNPELLEITVEQYDCLLRFHISTISNFKEITEMLGDKKTTKLKICDFLKNKDNLISLLGNNILDNKNNLNDYTKKVLNNNESFPYYNQDFLKTHIKLIDNYKKHL